MVLVVTITIASLVTWHKFRGSLVGEHARIRAWNIALFLFAVYGFWYFVQEVRFHGIKIWFNAFIDALCGGFLKFRLIKAVYRLPLEPAYKLIVGIRIIMILFVTIIPTLLAILQIFKSIHTKMDAGKIILVEVAVSYFLFLIPLGIGVIESIWSLRPFHILMLFSPILVALLFPRKLFRPLVIVTMLFSLITIYILWIPNLGYIQVPNEKAALIKFVSVYIPRHQTIKAIGTGWMEQTLLTHIFSSRIDLKLSSICDVLSHNWKYVETFNMHYVMVDPSIEKYEVKYLCSPEIRERVRYLSSVLMENRRFNKVYDAGSFYALYALRSGKSFAGV